MNLIRFLTAPWEIYDHKRRIAILEARISLSREERLRMTLAVIGAVSCAWAKIEMQIDDINELAYLNGAKDVVDAEIPMSLKRKLTFLRKSHRTLPWLKGLSDDADSLSQRVGETSQQRHFLVHGVAQNLGTDDLALLFVRNSHGPHELRREEKSFESSDFIGLATTVVSLLKALERHHSAMTMALLQNRQSYLKG